MSPLLMSPLPIRKTRENARRPLRAQNRLRLAYRRPSVKATSANTNTAKMRGGKRLAHAIVLPQVIG